MIQEIFASLFVPPEFTPFQTALFILILIPTLIALRSAPWVPTPKARVRRMLELANIKPGETVVDLGCGDGRLVHIASAEFKAKGIGLELSPIIYSMALCAAPFYWMKGSKAKIRFRNFHKMSLNEVDVVVCYLLPSTIKRITEKLANEMRPGSRVISYAFPILEWEPTHREERVREKGFCPIWVYEIGKSNRATAKESPAKSMDAKGKRAKSSATIKTHSKKRLAKAATPKPKGQKK